MKNLRTKLYVVIAVILLVAVIFVGLSVADRKNENNKEVGEITTNLKVTLGDEEIREVIVLENGGTVKDQYKKAVLEFNDDAGYVTKIGNKSSEGMCGFVFEVNDKEIMEAADKVELNDGDTVHWFYVCFE